MVDGKVVVRVFYRDDQKVVFVSEELSRFTISNYVKIKRFKDNFDIAAAGNYFPLKKMLKRWPYIPMRPKNGYK